MYLIDNKLFYSFLLILTIFYPLLYSFNYKFKFYKNWANLFIGIFFMSFIFISWDIYFTKMKIWSFNDKFTLGYKFFNLPIEEWLFFLIIPYSCVFIYESVKFFINTQFSKKIIFFTTIILILILSILLIIFRDKLYTKFCFFITIFSLAITISLKREILSNFYISYLFSLIPFIIINGFLTGSFTREPIVSYNSDELIGIRFLNIPFEDFFYSMSMLIIVILVYEIKLIRNNNF